MAMADVKPAVQRFPWMTPAGGAIGPAGLTVDEVKVHQGKAPKGAVIQPLAERGPVQLIAPTTSSEQLRLAVPEAANPFATPTGPRHDHMMVRSALLRAGTATSGELVRLLKGNPAGVDDAAVGQMRASLAREHAMCSLLQRLQEMQEHIYGRIIGHQEA
jgi:hypothetical protein